MIIVCGLQLLSEEEKRKTGITGFIRRSEQGKRK
jgi:hypothetical protein